MDNPRNDIQIGDIIDSRYEVLEKLGEGSFGVVYRSRQISTGQTVAIKILMVEGESLALEFERFEREVHFIAKLHHPNIVRLIDSGKNENGRPYMVLEYIKGQPLDEFISKVGALKRIEATELMTQVLDALGCAHGAGVVHRDLKPANIMVTTTGVRLNAVVLDFGISSIVEQSRPEMYQTLTSPDEVLGTPPYMAPEQLRKIKITPQSDLYAWGLIFIEVLTGKVAIPFCEGNLVRQAFWQCSKEPLTIPASIKNENLRRLIRHATEKDLEKRSKSAGEILKEIRGPLSGAPKSLSTIKLSRSLYGKFDPSSRLNPQKKFIILGSIFLFLLLIIAGWLFLSSPKEFQLTKDNEPAICEKNTDCSSGDVCGLEKECLQVEAVGCRLSAGKIDDRTVLMGGIFKLSEAAYQMHERAILLALQEIEEAGGLPGGRSLTFVSCDDLGETPQGVLAARHLSKLGVSAIIGPEFSSTFIRTVTEVTKDAGVVTLSPAASSPAITTLRDNGFAWRLVPGDHLQGQAIGELLKLEEHAQVALFVKKGAYGSGLLDALSANIQNTQNIKLKAFRYGASGLSKTQLKSAFAGSPNIVIVMGSFEIASIIRSYEEYAQQSGVESTRYLTSEAGFKPELISLLKEKPQLRDRVQVVSLIDDNAVLFPSFALRFEALYGTLLPRSKTAMAYDAAYMLAYAMFSIPEGEAITGRGVRAGLQLLLSGDPLAVGPASIGEARAALGKRKKIDLLGVSGSLDLDPQSGDAPGDFDLIKLGNQDGSSYTSSGYFDPKKGWIFPNKKIPPESKGPEALPPKP